MVLVNADGSDDLGWVADLICFFVFWFFFREKRHIRGHVIGCHSYSSNFLAPSAHVKERF